MRSLSLVVLSLAAFGAPSVEGALLRAKNATTDAVTAKSASKIEIPPWVSSCKSIYLDLGSNIGVQIRKFYEPQRYPGATVIPMFDKYFGYEEQRRKTSSESGICILGFEPNQVHQDRLRRIEAAYMAKGWHVHFFQAAVWSSNGVMTFTGGAEDPAHKDWGAKLKTPLALAQIDIEVPTVDIAEFVHSLPANSVKLMKMDIEGAEYESISHMISKKALCANDVAVAFCEAHGWGNTTNWYGARDFATIKYHVDQQQGCPGRVTDFIALDDESYLHDVDDNFAQPYR